ncbi:MAG: hypothetical protein ACOH19_06480 [Rhodoglobus sp.]
MDHGTESLQQTVQLPSEGRRGIDRYSIALITQPTTFSTLRDEVLRLSALNSGRTFVTLDNLSQCLYTSGHAVNRHDLDGDVEYPDDDSRGALDDYEAAVFAASLAVLNAAETSVAWSELSGALVTGEADIDALVELNRHAERLLDDVHVVQSVPDGGVSSLLANIPNGYFESDWTPFQGLAVTRRLAERHGYEPWGIGASTLAFLSVLDDPGERDAPALIEDLQHLYGHPDAPAWTKLSKLIAVQPILILGYAEDFAALTADE